MLSFRSSAGIGTVATITLGALTGMSQPSKATDTDIDVEISCRKQESIPSVVAKLSKGEQTKEITMLSFLSEYFSEQVAIANCQQTAATLNSLYQADQAKYLTNSIVEDKAVVCAVTRRGLACDSYQAQPLFTLADSSNVEPNQAFYQMLGKKFKPSQPPTNRTLGRIYTNIELTKRNWWRLFW